MLAENRQADVKKRLPKVAFAIVILSLLIILVVAATTSLGELLACLHSGFHHFLIQPLGHEFHFKIFAAEMWIVLGITMLLERIFPADPSKGLFHVGLLQDFVWFILQAVQTTLVLGTYVVALIYLHQTYCPGLAISVEFLPDWARFVLAVLLWDFLIWAQHNLNHRIRFLWEFHKVHHSQESLNFFTQFRYHIVEYFVQWTLVTIPFLLLSVNPPLILAFAFFKEWYARFYHGNIRLGFGWLRYVLVTPQSHRIHHSRERKHFDTNFGGLFSIWDYLFGTAYRGYDEYPETGIHDTHFPLEKPGDDVTTILLKPIHQSLEPIASLCRKAASTSRRRPQPTTRWCGAAEGKPVLAPSDHGV